MEELGRWRRVGTGHQPSGCAALLVVASAWLITTGCTTPYKRNGLMGGYDDYKAGDRTIYVSFQGNGYTDRSTVNRYWHLRAAEVCGGEDQYEVIARDSREATSASSGSASYSGTATTIGNTTTYSGTVMEDSPIRYTAYGADGYVRCVNGGTYNSKRNLWDKSKPRRAATLETTPDSEAAAEARAEALRHVRSGQQPSATPRVSAREPSTVPAEPGCQHDMQCKGDRVCVEGQCVDPSDQDAPPSAPSGPASTTGASDF